MNIRSWASTPTQDRGSGSSVNYFSVVRWRADHLLSISKSISPFLNEVGRFSQVFGLVALAVWYITRQIVCCSGSGFQGFTQWATSVIDVAFSLGVFVRDTPSAPCGSPRLLGSLWPCAILLVCVAEPSLHPRIVLHELHGGC